MRYKRVKKILEFWCLFIGIGAIYGSLNMLIDPTGKSLGMDGMLKYFGVLPFSDVLFQDYTFSGISLLIVNGITNISAYILLLKNKKLGVVLGMTFGITLMLWITIQFIIFPMNILSTMFFIFGLLQFITGYITYVFYTQNEFKFDIDNYKNMIEEKPYNKDILKELNVYDDIWMQPNRKTCALLPVKAIEKILNKME